MTSELIIHRLSTGESRVVHRSEELFEAPNWSPDSSWLLINSGGRLHRIDLDEAGATGAPVLIDSGPVDKINNDHCISPDGRTIYVSNGDGHLYAIPSAGGEPRRITNERRDFQHYLHGVSPDGSTLAYIGVESGADGARRSNVFTIPAAGGQDVRLTDLAVQNDGCEFTPDGASILFNSELDASTPFDKLRTAPGDAQLFRMDVRGGDVIQLTFDERVNWFPHPSPDGTKIIYLSYPPGTEGHPADKDVIIRLLPGPDAADADATEPVNVAAFRGGQGTINVNSWAPDSDRFGYVRYPA